MEEMLLHTENTEGAIAEIKSIGGRVMLQLGDNLLVAKVPRNFIAKKKSFASASAHISASASPETLTYVQAYYMALEKKTRPQPQIQRWTDKTAPVALARKFTYPDEENSPYGRTLTGKIVAAAIIVSGPGNLAISDAEKNKILSEVTAGLQFWSDSAPEQAYLKFQLFHAYVFTHVPENTYCPTYEACHDVFTDPVLNDLGYPGPGSKDQFARDLKDSNGADGAYLAFFSKYKQKHFAYSYTGSGPVYMQYSNDGWGPNQIDRVFAHETGHVFNALDEYSGCNCFADYGKGICTAKNGNCRDCTGNQINCIMDSNDFTTCSHTRKHVGWCAEN